jgi:hypothetical protein
VRFRFLSVNFNFRLLLQFNTGRNIDSKTKREYDGA